MTVAPEPAAEALTVARALAHARAQGLDRLDAQRLLGHLLQQGRGWLIAHDDQPLPAATASTFAEGCRRCAAGEPLAYVLGECEFHGLTLQVSPAVLVPRPDTETLVDWALELLPALATPHPRVIDLGTGSGAIALAVAYRRPGASVMATDLSPGALAMARANAQRLNLPVAFAGGAWWSAVPDDAQYDLVLSNPPYIAGDDAHLPALRHEPLLALTPGGDGLDALREIVAGAPAHLALGGWLLRVHPGHVRVAIVASAAVGCAGTLALASGSPALALAGACAVGLR
jgi:release factor glutamine methyltransferase